MKRLNHKEMEQIITTYMVNQGWQRIKNGRLGLFPKVGIDRIFVKGKQMLAFEIKPTDATSGEILKGIGQCTRVLPYRKLKPYLFIAETALKHIESQLPYLPWLGVMVIDCEARTLSMAQQAQNRDVGKDTVDIKIENSQIKTTLGNLSQQRSHILDWPGPPAWERSKEVLEHMPYSNMASMTLRALWDAYRAGYPDIPIDELTDEEILQIKGVKQRGLELILQAKQIKGRFDYGED